MKLSDIVQPAAITQELGSVQREEVLRELVESLVEAGVADASHTEELFEKILERERRHSTGFGKGVAVPHVKHRAVTRLAAAIGVSQRGIEFDAMDKQPVYTVFMLLTPADRPEDHLQAMEAIFKNLSTESFRRGLRQASSREDIVTLLNDADGPQPAG
ncbi:MAG: PTS sugar transporter subunit IIA [Planctomycetota bacterium]